MTDDQRDEDARIRITVKPEPTEEEAAAIVAAVTMLASVQPSTGPAVHRTEDRWRIAGRQDVLRGSSWPPVARHEEW